MQQQSNKLIEMFSSEKKYYLNGQNTKEAVTCKPNWFSLFAQVSCLSIMELILVFAYTFLCALIHNNLFLFLSAHMSKAQNRRVKYFFFCEVYDLQQEELFKIRTVKKIKTKKRKNGAFALCYVEIGGSLKG